MALVEVTFPSGYVVDQYPISDAATNQPHYKKAIPNPIRKMDVLFGGTSVVVYYDNMYREINCFAITAYRRLKVALKRPAYVLVHDYYNPKLNAIRKYDVDQQNVCDICENDDCPDDCSANAEWTC